LFVDNERINNLRQNANMLVSAYGEGNMKGLWLESGQFSFRDDLPMPQAGEGELLLRTLCTGICGTDLELQRGYYNFTGIAGHEFVAEVVGGGAFSGQRIVADINIGCGQCSFCEIGLNNHCSDRTVVGIKNRPGAFAEFLTIPEKNIFPVPDTLSNLQAVLIEPVAAALEILEQVVVEDQSDVLIIGAGRLGTLIAHVLVSAGLNVDIQVRNPLRQKHFDHSSIRIVTDIKQNDYSLVIECSGHTEGFSSAVAAIRPRGTIVMKSTYASSLNFDASHLVVNEISLVGSRCGPTGKAIQWMQENDLGQLEISTLGFENVELAFERASDPTIYKVVFSSDDS
jgi:threonine dehydrogenase-like Zn-dependent dehydrogenase